MLEAVDTLLQAVLDPTKSQPKIEMALKVLQQGLRTKQPMCMFAMLGAEQGAKLTRTAFSVILKFSDNVQDFLGLVDAIGKTLDEFGAGA